MSEFLPKNSLHVGHKNTSQTQAEKYQAEATRQFAKSLGKNNFGKSMGNKNFGKSMRGQAPTLQERFRNSSPLDQTVQDKMANSFQEDFSEVKVTKESDEPTQMGAQALRKGNDVHFAPGKFNPGSSEGQELIGHEFTHVVKQKQGRVKATTQAKGAPVNDDPALESEADAMGKKAASGEQAVVQRKSEKGGVQRQAEPEEKINIKVQVNTFTEDVVVKGLNNLGSFSYISGTSGKRVHEYVLTGTKEQWSQILKYADSGGNFMTFIIGFLKASNNPSWVEKGDSNPWKGDKKTNIKRAPNSNEKLEFLKALYSVDVKTDLDLADKWFEKTLTSLQDVTTPVLAEFIGKHQHLLIHHLSKQSKNQHFASSGIEAVAEEGTHNVFRPVLVKSMMQNAFATAVSAAKLIIMDSVEGSSAQSPSESINSIDIVANSAIILKSAITTYGKEIKSLKEGIGGIFDHAWGVIPFTTNPAVKIIASEAQKLIKSSLISSLSFPQTDKLSEEYSRKFSSIIKQTCTQVLENHKDSLNQDRFVNAYRDLISSFESFID